MKNNTQGISLIFILMVCVFALQAQQPNIIFITIDDLNDWTSDLGGHPQVETPNLTNLAQLGTLFTNAYCSAPQCGPSRTSMLTGKDVAYTQVYDNTTYKCKNFRKNFTAAKGNEEVVTLPEFLKDNANYFTYSINKIFHCYENKVEYDTITVDPCSKGLSWNRITLYQDDDVIHPIGDENNEGIETFRWYRLNDTLKTDMEDYIAVDTAIKFIHDYANGDVNTCDRPFFLALGITKPHHPLYVPKQYFLNEYYQGNFYELPFDKSYNDPPNAFPYNGVVMPPQPDTMFNDFNHLGFMGQALAHPGIYNTYEQWREDLDPMPVVEEGISDSLRNFILEESERANGIMGYLAAIKFADDQLGRFMNELVANPSIYHNTIIICIGDNGFSLGEKMHWRKGCMWETDIRVPVIIADLRNPEQQICNTTISLLDLFPTICDMLDIDPPTFEDGSPYLDGESLVPLLENPSLKLERPQISTIKDEQGNQGSCYPQYSVRDQRFHYIRYQSNNVEGVLECDEAASIIEEEFYDVGVNRETDPNEWNNLINNEDYAPVVDYMHAFLPGGSMYLVEPDKVEITNKSVACFLNDHTSIKLKSNLYDADGTIIGGAALADYEFKWWNNLTDDTLYGKSVNFYTATIDAADFYANDKFFVYLIVTKISSGEKVAFTTKTFYIDPANIPVVNFNLVNNAALLTTQVVSYSLTGSYYNTYWNFGDGHITEDYLPPVYTYALPGNYTVTNYVQYGNGCTKSKSRIADETLKVGESDFEFAVFPNPANNFVNILMDETPLPGEIEIVNILGQIVYAEKIAPYNNTLRIDTEDFPAGTYIIRIKIGEIENFSLLEII